MDNDITVDIVKIKLEGEDSSATSTLDKVISKLNRIKSAASLNGTQEITTKIVSSSGVSKLDRFKKKLSQIKSSLTGLGGRSVSSPQLDRLKSQAEQSADRIEGLKSKIYEMNNSFSEKPTYLMQTLIDKENELEAAASRVKAQITDTTPQALLEKYTQQYSELRSQIEQVSSKQLKLQDSGRAFLTNAQVQPEAVEKLNEQLSQEQSKYSDINDKIKEASSSTKSFGIQAKSAFSTSLIGKFASKIKSLASSIKRIMLYRTIRSLISSITSGFKTGISNMYQYSKEFSGSFSQSMDSIASSALTVKNSLAAALTPLIEQFAPYVEKISDKILEINNNIAMVIAGLSGKTTYTKALKATTEYAAAANDASDKTSKVKDSVEDLKRSLAGLDEITIIGDNSASSSVSSAVADATNSGTDYSTMFEEAPVNMAKISELKKKLEEIWDVVKWIGIAFAAWELTKIFSDLGLLSNKLSGLTFVGLVLTITGAVLLIKGIKNVITDGMNWENFWTLFFSGAAFTVGTTILGNVIAKMTGNLNWKGIGTKIGLGVTGAAMLFSGLYDTITNTIDNGKGDLESTFISYFSSVIGGALIGTAIAPGIGTAIGALVGAIADSITFFASNPETVKKGTDAIVQSWEKGTLASDLKSWIQQSLVDSFQISPDTAGKIAGVLSSIVTIYVSVWETIKKLFSSQVTWFKNLFVNIVNYILEQVEVGINAVVSVVNWFIGLTNNIMQGITNLTGKTLYTIPTMQSVSIGRIVMTQGSTPKYADGGFPEDGFFFANHNELVGQFSNGRTAVANNEQIVEGISDGVSQANEETNKLLRENNSLMRQLLAKESTIPVSTISSAFNRQNRRNGKVTVPVGT